ncbi:MAG: flagellar biosynthesis protein FlhB [Candidatus Zixiibacteriota bacterium]
MAEESFQEKTEPATPRRREEARKKGQVARSAELNSFAVLFAGVLLLFFVAPSLITGLSALMRHYLGNLAAVPVGPEGFTAILRHVAVRTAIILVPLFGVVVVVGVVINAAQVGFQMTAETLQPRLDKLNLVGGFKRLFSRRSLVELLRDLLKLTLIGIVAYYAVRSEFGGFVTLTGADPVAILTFVGGAIFRVAIKIVLALLLLALFDYAFQRWDYERSLRMSKYEVREELKQYEGSPLMRSRIRQVQRELARMRMTREIPKADVVVTNPTELAVALKYDADTMSAPTVVAKGARLLAQKIREIAAQAHVPIVENPPLARALYASVEVGAIVPAELYRATAEVLAYVYRLRGRVHAAEAAPEGASS